MKIIRYTLVAEGSSDRVLIPIINWLIEKHFPEIGIQSQQAGNLGAGLTLRTKISKVISLFPCDVLFIHRDCDRETYEARLQEIEDATQNTSMTHVPIIPIRMTEAWLFSDELAIRTAAENKNGRVQLNLPDKKKWESLPDPKDVLFNALKLASGKSARALQGFNLFKARARITELTKEFEALRGINGFDCFESRLVEAFQGL